MNKKAVLTILLVLSIQSRCLAYQTPEKHSFQAIYTVADTGIREEKSYFLLDESPYLYARIPELSDNDVSNANSIFWFKDEDEFVPKTFAGDQNNQQLTQEFWMTPNDWNDVKTAGQWMITANFGISDLTGFEASRYGYTTPGDGAYFFNVGKGFPVTVTPEPISMFLFFIGGSVLFLMGYMSKVRCYKNFRRALNLQTAIALYQH